MADAHYPVDACLRCDEELYDAISRLVPQLSKSSSIPTAEELEAIIASDATTLLVARDGEAGPIVGSLTLVIFRIPTGVRAWIEDVVVDERYRGRGVAVALNQEAIERSRGAGARTVDLTSRPSRAAANQLYKKIGFKLRDSNVYRLTSP